MRAQWLAGAISILVCQASGQTLPPGLTSGERLPVREVIDGETVRLGDGRELRLAAILAPRSTPPRAGQPARPDAGLERLALAAREVLATLIEGRDVVLYVAPGPQRDRHGRLTAHVATPAAEWVQAVLVSNGLARVQTTAEIDTGADLLLRLESEAREAQRGLWRHEAFRIRAPDELGRWIETFQIVEGAAVVLAGHPAGRLALEGQRERLILNLSTRARAELRDAGWNVDRLAGMPLRVRGWLRWQNGPVIDVTHAAQIERLVPPRK